MHAVGRGGLRGKLSIQAKHLLFEATQNIVERNVGGQEAADGGRGRSRDWLFGEEHRQDTISDRGGNTTQAR